MLETLVNPKKAERKPWELFFVGLLYAAVSLLMANWLFAGNPIFSDHISILVITFTVMLSLPFVYFTIKVEESEIINDRNNGNKSWFVKEHGRAISAFVWLFLGFLVTFSAFYILFPQLASSNFQAQIEQYCNINAPYKFEDCVSNAITANATGGEGSRVMDIFANNLYVLIFCVVFSLVFGAGAIFILAWNATVIAAAVGIFSKSSITVMPLALARYMIHGIPEIAAYFTAALAGGIISVALIRHDIKDPRFWKVMADSINLIVISIIILILATLVEVFVTPQLF